MIVLIWMVLFWGVPMLIAHRLGASKGRPLAVLWAVFLGWLGVLIVALLGPGMGVRSKQCPECLGVIPQAATRCRHCGAAQP